ncbi:MFS transporter [Raineyella sp.]|uniref:MFS transporter n=1 Tax=Raineyella sp. TaxID=1911550 RepID=UPI002B1FC2AF|nr:MFS transporter [Raineyella sp.]MEA5155324.1 MFS transporter [Raineyella sp.]
MVINETTAAPQAVSHPDRPTRYRVVLAAILFITLLVSYLDRTNISVLVADPKFLHDMGIAGQPAKMGMFLTVFLLAYGVANIVLAPLGNVMGPRWAMLLAVVVWAVSVILGGLAGGFGMMIATRVLLGAGEGLHWPMQSLFVTNWFPPRERSKANAAWLLGLMVGPMIAMPIITSVVAANGWRSSFWLLAGLSVVPMLLLFFFTQDIPAASRFVGRQELDHIETGIRAAKASAAAETGAHRAFVADWRFWLIVLGFLCSSSVFWGVIGWLPSYLKSARGFSFAQLGTFASLPYMLGAITVVIFGFVADRYRHKGVFPTIALFGAAVCIYAGATVKSNIASALILSLAMGFIGVGLSSYWTMMQTIVHHAQIGAAAGVMNGVAQILSAFVPTIVGALIGSAGHYSNGLMFLVGAGCLGGISMGILALKRV